MSIDPTIGQGDVSVRVTGVHADSFAVFGDKLFLTNAGRAVDVLFVANAGSLQITPTYGTDVTTLTFHTG